MAEEHDDDLVMQSLLLDEIGQSVIGVDARWRVTYWNRASERLYGYSASQVIGAEVARLGMLARGTSEAEIREIQERIANGGTWSGELWIHHPAGREFPVHATISSVHGRHTTPVAVVAISKDITDRKHNEAVLRRFSAMVESSGDAIVSADMTGTITSWNAGAARMFGWTAREAVGLNYRLLTTRDAEDFAAEVKASIASGKFVTGLEVRWSRKNGTVIEVELTVSPVYGQGGEQAGVSVIARDITEIQRLRAAAAVEREKLLAAQEMAHVGSVEHTMGTGETWHSEEFGRIFGLDAGQVASRELMLELTHPEDRALVQRTWLGLDEGSGFADFEYRIVRPMASNGGCTPAFRNGKLEEGKPAGSSTPSWTSPSASRRSRSWSGGPGMMPSPACPTATSSPRCCRDCWTGAPSRW